MFPYYTRSAGNDLPFRDRNRGGWKGAVKIAVSYRNELLEVAASKYVHEHKKSVVYQREESAEFKYASGYLVGICSAFQVDYEITKIDEQNSVVRFYHQDSRRKFMEITVTTN